MSPISVARPPNGTLAKLQAASRASGDASRPLPRPRNVFR